MALHGGTVGIVLDRLHINGPKDLDARAGLRELPVSASFWATGLNEMLFKEIQQTIKPEKETLFGMTLLDDLLVARYLGDSPQKARDLFTMIWGKIRPELTGRKPCWNWHPCYRSTKSSNRE